MSRAQPTAHVVLVCPQIPWNAGNAGRTCLAAGARLHLVGPLGFSLAERRLRRAGLDYWRQVDLALWSGWDELSAALPAMSEPWLFSAEGSRSLWEVDLGPSPVLVFGNESEGLAAGLRQEWAQRLVRIPQEPGSVRSLNLSTAVAVAVYEVVRRRDAGLG